MAQRNQPFKRPNLSESEEYTKIPPPSGQESKFVPPSKNQPGGNQAQNQGDPNYRGPVAPPSQEEINWAILLEENVQKKGYKPTDAEMATYQDIANRIVMFQQAQAQAQMQAQAQAQAQQQNVKVVTRKKSKLFSFIKLLTLATLAVLFWAKISVIVLKPSYYVPRGKIYFVIKPVNFQDTYFNLNMDKIYEEKLKKGFTKEELNLETEKPKGKKKGKTKINPNWYIDPLYWEKNYIFALPYIKIKLDF